jgi:membrane protein
MDRLRTLYEIARDTVTQFIDERGPRMAAALAFYTLFSFAPVVIIAVAVAGLFFGREIAQARIVSEVEALVGIDGAHVLDALIQSVREPSSGATAAIIGVIALLFGASGVFGELQDALNTVWNVKPKPGRAVVAIVKRRFLSFAMVFGTGFLLLVSLVISASLTAFAEWGGRAIPAFLPFLRIVEIGVSFAVITVLFALTFRLVPDVRLPWRDVWPGAAVTSALFGVGKFALGFYLGDRVPGSAYAAVGSLLVLLLWVYYSSQIVLLGAELTQVWSSRRRQPRPKEGATVEAKTGRIAVHLEERRRQSR